MATIANMNVRLAMDAGDFEKGIDKAAKSTESLSQKLGKAGASMTAAVTLPLAGIAVMALKSAGDFEASMNVLQSVSGATAGDMAALEAQALELGASTAFSAGEAAEAMLELGKAGLVPTDIIGAMPGVLSLAAAGNMEVAEAATVAANAVNTFGLAASDTTEVANMLAAAANASSADVSDLAAGFQMSGSVFAAMGQSMSDLTTGIALMSNAGISGSDAGTSLKTMMMRLSAPTKEASGAINKLGLEVYNADGSMKSFENIVGQLEKATAGLTDEQRNMAFSTIFGADAIRAAIIMTDAGAAGFAEMETAVNKAGAAEEAAAARMKGLTGALDYMQGSIDSAMIALSKQFLPVISEMLRGVADMVTGFTTLSPELQAAGLAFAAVAAAAGPVMLVLSGIGGALGLLLSPITLVVAAVAGLAVAWATNFGGIRDITTAALGPVIEGLQSFARYIGFVLESGDPLNDWLTHLPESVRPVVQAIGELITYFQSFGRYIGFVLESGDPLNDWLTHLPEPIRPAVQAIGELITYFQSFGRYIGFVLESGDPLNDWLTHLPDAARPAAEAIGSVIAAFQTGAISISFADSLESVGVVTRQLVANFTALALALQTFFAPAIARVQEAFTAMGPALSELSGPLARLQESFMQLWVIVQPILAGLAQAIGVTLAIAVDVGINTLAATIEALPAIITAAVNNITATITLISTTVRGVVDLIKAMIDGDWAAAWTAAEGILEGFATFFSETFFNFNAIATAVMKGLQSIVVNTLTDMGVDIGGIMAEISSQWNAIWDGMSKMIQPVLDAIDALKKGIQNFQTWISGISMPNPFASIGQSSVGTTANAIDTAFVDLVTGRASGGPVTAGTPYIVGERGPELMVPSRSGTIIPNDFSGAWGGGMAGSGVTIENVAVYNEIDLQALAYQVAQLLGRRR